MRVAVAGSGWYAASVLLSLLDSPHETVALIQNGRRVRGMNRRIGPAFSFSPAAPCGVARIGHRHGIPVIWLDAMDAEELAPLDAFKPDLLLVAGFGIILQPSILNLPRLGCVNVHPSLLPRHRGPNPFSAVVLAGERESGVTFHQMDAGIDTGPILARYSFALGPRETADSVHAKACAAAAAHVVEVLDGIEAGTMAPQPQDESAASYDKRTEDNRRWLEWDQPATLLDLQVRALTGPASARFTHKGRPVHVLAAHADCRPVEAPPGTVLETRPWVSIATGEGRLRILRAVHGRAPLLRWPAPWTRLKAGELLS